VTGDANVELRPVLGAIARAWKRIQPTDLTANEAFSLLSILMQIEDRLDDAVSTPRTCDAMRDGRPALRLIRDHHP
jgi:hypothetical protein